MIRTRAHCAKLAANEPSERRERASGRDLPVCGRLQRAQRFCNASDPTRQSAAIFLPVANVYPFSLLPSAQAGLQSLESESAQREGPKQPNAC